MPGLPLLGSIVIFSLDCLATPCPFLLMLNAPAAGSPSISAIVCRSDISTFFNGSDILFTVLSVEIAALLELAEQLRENLFLCAASAYLALFDDYHLVGKLHYTLLM